MTVQPTNEVAKRVESQEDYKYYLPLCEASLRGDWGEAEAFLNEDREANRAPINSMLQTALHVAVSVKNRKAKPFIRKLVASMEDDALAIRDRLGKAETPLHYAARSGKLNAVQIPVNRNPELPYIACDNGLYPIHLAIEYAYENMQVVDYFFYVTEDPAPYTSYVGVRLLAGLIRPDLLA